VAVGLEWAKSRDGTVLHLVSALQRVGSGPSASSGPCLSALIARQVTSPLSLTAIRTDPPRLPR
jgi:hypothetical protein